MPRIRVIFISYLLRFYKTCNADHFVTARCNASAVLSCLSVCLSVSVTSRSFIETTGRIELFFCTEAFFDLSYRVLKRNSDIYKNNGTSLWDFVPNSGLRKFCHGISIVEACYRLISRKDGRPERHRRDRRLSTELTIPSSSDA